MSWDDDREMLKAQIAGLENDKANLTRQLAVAQNKLAEAIGEVATCPCNSPADHAGWCPRRERL